MRNESMMDAEIYKPETTPKIFVKCHRHRPTSWRIYLHTMCQYIFSTINYYISVIILRPRILPICQIQCRYTIFYVILYMPYNLYDMPYQKFRNGIQIDFSITFVQWYTEIHDRMRFSIESVQSDLNSLNEKERERER